MYVWKQRRNIDLIVVMFQATVMQEIRVIIEKPAESKIEIT